MNRSYHTTIFISISNSSLLCIQPFKQIFSIQIFKMLAKFEIGKSLGYKSFILFNWRDMQKGIIEIFNDATMGKLLNNFLLFLTDSDSNKCMNKYWHWLEQYYHSFYIHKSAFLDNSIKSRFFLKNITLRLRQQLKVILLTS